MGWEPGAGAYELGVDLGTTFTAAAVQRAGRAELVTLGDRAPVIPSVVFLTPEGGFLIGEAAERRAVTDPSRVAREVKRRFGDPTPILLAGSPFGAPALQAELLRWVVARVTEREGGPPSSVTLTHPANWGPYKRDLLYEVARLAGLADTPRLLTEPEAAALDYADRERVPDGSIIGVYDLGGGTFDATVVEKTAEGARILGQPAGVEHLGGVDFDSALFDHVRQSIAGSLAGLDPADSSTRQALARLRDDVVAAKEALSSDTSAVVPVVLPGLHTDVRVTRAEFEAMIRPSLSATVAAFDRAVASAGIGASQLRAILLVGGSSRIPLVGELIGAATGRPVAVDVHPKHAVALGAVTPNTPRPAIGEGAGGPTPPSPPGPAIPAPVSEEPPPPPPPGPVPAPVGYAAAAAPPPGAPPPPPGAGPPPGAPPAGGPPVFGPQPKLDTGGRRTARVVASVIALAGIVAGAFFLVNQPEDKASAGELFLEPIDEPGPDPFSESVATSPRVTVPPSSTSTPDARDRTVQIETVEGSEPGLYGGTRSRASCDPAKLVEFLEDNPDKAAAWASVHRIRPDQIRAYVATLTPVVLRRDTRVTNHGFTNGRATPRQAVLQAGTAVLVDPRGVPRVKCECGNPLAEPVAISGSPRTTGREWPGYQATGLVAPRAGDQLVAIVVIDVETAQPFVRPVGTDGSEDEDAPPEIYDDLGIETTTTTTTTTPAPTDVTAAGAVSANSSTPGYGSALAVDGSVSTSWFSLGPGAGSVARYTWSADQPFTITEVQVIGNAAHPEFPTGFGFAAVEVVVLSGGAEVYRESFGLGGTPDPDITASPNVVGEQIVLEFTGHESQDCGGFAELIVLGR